MNARFLHKSLIVKSLHNRFELVTISVRGLSQQTQVHLHQEVLWEGRRRLHHGRQVHRKHRTIPQPFMPTKRHGKLQSTNSIIRVMVG